MLPDSGHSGQHKPRILVVAHADGFIEIFSGGSLDCHFVNRPKMLTPNGGQLADDFIEWSIPRRFRPLFFPGYCRATGNVQAVRPDQLAADHLSIAVNGTLTRLTQPMEVSQ